MTPFDEMDAKDQKWILEGEGGARRFALPENADEQGITAESRDGVILIHIPKVKVVQPQPRQIQVQ